MNSEWEFDLGESVSEELRFDPWGLLAGPNERARV
jgi:hypothetical protein